MYKACAPLFFALLLQVAASACAPTTTVKTAPPQVTLTSIAIVTDQELPAGTDVMTQAELQSELMSFADRYAVVLGQAFNDFDEQSPPRKIRHIAVDDTAYSSSAAFIIAAGPNPEVALLDMAVLTTLGRLVYEEHWRPQYGESVDYMVNGFRILEEDIWEILARVSTPVHQQELRDLIYKWRRDNAGQLLFSYIRFGDFATARQKSTIVDAAETGGVFESVQQATQQVEQTRLLAERSMYLATRLPLLSGTFVDLWLSQWSQNPDLQRALNDFDKFAIEAKRLVDLAEQLPGNITKVQQAAVTQTMDRFAEERKKTIEEFLAEEERIGVILSELRGALVEGNKLVTSIHSLTDQLNLATPPTGDSKPFDIIAYRETIAEANITLTLMQELTASIEQLHQLPGWERIIPQIDTTIDRVGAEGEEIVDHTFKQILLLILIWMVAYFVVRLTLHYLLSKKGTRGTSL